MQPYQVISRRGINTIVIIIPKKQQKNIIINNNKHINKNKYLYYFLYKSIKHSKNLNHG